MDYTVRMAYRLKSRGYQKDPPALIHPCILIGAGEMLTPNFQKKYGITHVINCAEDDKCPSWFKNMYPERYHCIGAKDSLTVNILSWYPEFRECMKDFLKHKESKTIYVHCQCGINRSAFLALMFVCDVFSYPFDSAYLSILSQRPCALTNSSFLNQIKSALSKKSD